MRSRLSGNATPAVFPQGSSFSLSMHRLIWLVTALVGVVGFLLGLVVVRSNPSAFDPVRASVQRPASANAGAAATPMVVQTQAGAIEAVAPGVDFAPVAARVNAAVVNVDAAIRGDGQSRLASPRWRRDLTEDPSVPREGTGSGFIIDPSGYILTNFHVVEGADRLTVTLGDGRSFRAEVTGVDPALDVALIKISGSDPLPVAVLGDSSTLRVGQWVCAIGNPLGYVHSVTVGVVSFLGRKLFDQTLDAYIQTDAAISLGNSGGPLIDAAGRVIGMTSAVSSQAANIGFAIPISQVLEILPQLRERGRVSRGFLGIGVTQVTPDLQAALGLTVGQGALIQEVTPATPADRAGLRPYDVVVAADGRDIRSDEALIRHIAAGTPGAQMQLDVVRDKHRQTVALKLTERPLPPSAQSRLKKTDARLALAREQGPLGMTVRDLDGASALRRALPDTIQGVVVVEVDPAGPARLARVRPGQIVLELNRRVTLSATAFQAALAAIPRGTAAAVLVYDPITDQRRLVTIVPDRQ